MKIIYEAFDGTQFDNEFVCTDYEWAKNHTEGLRDIIFHGKNGEIYYDKLHENTYNNVMHIEILSEEGLKTLKDIADYTGFCCYYDVDSIGKWSWNKKEEKFKKNEISIDI